MATISFTVPDEVQDRFEEAFRGHDRSAVVTGLLLLAVEAQERRRLSPSLVKRLGSVRQSFSLSERLRSIGEHPPAAE